MLNIILFEIRRRTTIPWLRSPNEELRKTHTHTHTYTSISSKLDKNLFRWSKCSTGTENKINKINAERRTLKPQPIWKYNEITKSPSTITICENNKVHSEIASNLLVSIYFLHFSKPIVFIIMDANVLCTKLRFHSKCDMCSLLFTVFGWLGFIFISIYFKRHVCFHLQPFNIFGPRNNFISKATSVFSQKSLLFGVSLLDTILALALLLLCATFWPITVFLLLKPLAPHIIEIIFFRLFSCGI